MKRADDSTELNSVELPPSLPGESAEARRGAVARVLAARSTPAFLVSLIAHTAILILLAIWVFQVNSTGTDSRGYDLVATQTQRTAPDQLVIDNGQSDASLSVEAADTQVVSPSSVVSTNAAQTLTSLTVSGESAGTAQSNASEASALENLLSISSSNAIGAFVSSGVDGRKLDQRERIARSLGGNKRSEQAVENALKWIAQHQKPNGSWSLVHNTGKCDGRCRNPGSKERFDPAATGLALLAFLGAGYTHVDGPYKDNVQRGIYFLYQIMEESKLGGSFLYTSDRGMYNHGIAAFALCEAYQMTLDPDLKDAAQLSVDFIVNAQSYNGGWGYLPGTPGDLTVSGWQVMTLKSAHAAGLDIPAQIPFRVDLFLDTQRVKDSHQFTYRRRDEEAPTCTAIGNLIRMFRGTSTTDPVILEAAQYFLKKGLSRNDIYYNYYGSLYLFHIGGPMWEQWNAPVRDYLIQTQATRGHEAGSWYFDNPYGKEGGRLYTTAMAAMTLEVYYRFSPLYQQVNKPFEL